MHNVVEKKENCCNKKDHMHPTYAWFERYIARLYSGCWVYPAVEAKQQELEQLFHNNVIFLILRPLH